MEKKQFNNFNKKNLTFLIIILMIVFIPLVATLVNALTDTIIPTIISVSPANNERDVSRNESITMVFSKDMNSSTINANTIMVMQRTTPEFGEYKLIAIDGIVTYDGRTATFTPNDMFSPNQQYGNVFTVTITTEVKDLAGNSLSRNYVWSFITGGDSFNTGATTSQLDQSAVPITGFVTTPSSTQLLFMDVPITGTQVATTSNLSWIWWVVGGALLLLIIALISIVSINNINTTPQKSSRTRFNPFGDIHPVMDIEGIGPKYSKELQAMGIKNTKQLWETDTAKISREIGAPFSSVRSWQHMAELASVKDIGSQYAELLERSGVHSIGQLKSYDTDELLSLVCEKQDSLKINIQGNTLGQATVGNWIEEARNHKFSNVSDEGQIA